MRRRAAWGHRLARGLFFLLATSACDGLTDPKDQEGPPVTPEQALVLIGESLQGWFYGTHSYYSAIFALSNMAFQHSEPWNHASELYSRIPRVAFQNAKADGNYDYMTRSWFYSYAALRAVADGLRALEGPDAGAALETEEMGAARAFGKFVQGLAHATIALLFAEGFVVDEATDLSRPQQPIPYAELMARAMGYLDECAQLSSTATWTLPTSWMTVPLPGPELARVAHSVKARYQAAGARTPAERASLDWSAILADVAAGVTDDFIMFMDDHGGWSNDALGYGTYGAWGQMPYFIYGMADQSGNFQLWSAQTLSNKSHTVGGTPILIVTPDLRFPQGGTLEAQRAAPGRYFRVNREGAETGNTWARADRGTWRWSWYKHTRGEEYWNEFQYHQPEIRMEEMKLLKAEGLYRTGDRAAAAAIVNETRVAAGLSATDAAGTNTSCVPKLPDGQCGDLFEMLKWEKRMENTFKGPFGNLWFFEGRGWGDLWKGTWLHLPLPCTEAQLLLLPCKSFGGPGGEGAAALSTYRWNGEG